MERGTDPDTVYQVLVNSYSSFELTTYQAASTVDCSEHVAVTTRSTKSLLLEHRTDLETVSTALVPESRLELESLK